MALSDVIKKKQATGDGLEKEKAAKKNPLDDIRVVIVIVCRLHRTYRSYRFRCEGYRCDGSEY